MGGNKIPILLAVLAAGGVFAYFTYGPKPQPPAEPVLTAEAKSYLDQLALSDVGMEAADATIKMSLVTIKGKVTNKGTRLVTSVLVTCVFRDVNGQVIKRERVSLAGARTGPLAAGAISTFQVNFDNVPETWNQTLPDLVIAEIRFG